MSSYPKKAADGGYECQVCGEVWEDPVDAVDCCPPFYRPEAWHCDSGEDWCESGLHASEEDARRCMEQAVSDD